MSWYNDLVNRLNAPVPAWSMILVFLLLVSIGSDMRKLRDELEGVRELLRELKRGQ